MPLERFSQHCFGLSGVIPIRGIKNIDAVFNRIIDKPEHRLLVDIGAVRRGCRR